ncbi:hypothetical protein PIB30_073372 [Stylosanthes scabra]|uniref:FACT complex subunit n=1 Tax=Stylosanthes scabra TaxID=79078 RepID=A0ABU6ZMZ2_9FABA|nr:hypothetical protein [Stylosanthes scabra]
MADDGARQDFITGEATSMDHIRGLISAARGGAFAIEDVNGGRSWTLNPKEQMVLMEIPLLHQTGMYFVLDRDWSCVAVWRSNQTSLRLLCSTLKLPMPSFLMQTEEQTTRGKVHRFLVALPPGSAVDVLSMARRYSPDVHLAREDAAAKMIRAIIGETGFLIHDVNHERAEKISRSKEGLVEELQRVKDRMHMLMVKNMEFRDEYMPAYTHEGGTPKVGPVTKGSGGVTLGCSLYV